MYNVHTIKPILVLSLRLKLDWVDFLYYLPPYFSDKAYYDVVVIELDRNVKFEFKIFPVCLPNLATIERDSRKGQIATVSGYGSKVGSSTSTLHYASLNVLGKVIY